MRAKQFGHLYRKRDPMRKKFCRPVVGLAGDLSRKKVWCSTAHFHRCLHALSCIRRNTNVCSCSWPFTRQKQLAAVAVSNYRGPRGPSLLTAGSSYPKKNGIKGGLVFGLDQNCLFFIPCVIKYWSLLLCKIRFTD